ncbi:MAG: crossover junction endodeoxyribonuclease RuvC [Candidatus Spechtbacteria bacterium]|nr:crossover junction endodeoxyribonuclease RuvC [Candidatus Spechtbacteria bacterium]
MKILGIDPGTATTGYGIVEKKGSEVTCIHFGCVETPYGVDQAIRLHILRKELLVILEKYTPTLAGVEQLFFVKNMKTALSVAEARGVILETLHSKRVKIIECTPLQVKQAVTGYGKADKIQVQKMVKILLRLTDIPKPDDAADALAVAMYCANNSNFNS